MSANDQVTILMVDDQPGKLLTYEAILAPIEARLIRATSAREALEQLLKNEITIVLMDVNMPEMDGFELAEMIRQHPRYQKTAIIFISAARQTDLDRLKGYEVGAVDYIPAPVIPEIMRAKVRVLAELFHKTRQLEELNEELEQRVAERTAALEASMASEREARVAAEAALQVRDEFLSIAAHELKTPLTGLSAATQILVRKVQRGAIEAPPWLDNGLRTIDQQVDRLHRLTGRLLDVSRLDHDKLTIERASTNLTALAERLVAAFAVRTTRHTFVLAAEPDVVADVDADGMERVLSNLLDNALKYSPDGGQIDIEVSQADTNHFRLSVRDHGIGIPPEKREAIFQRFYQAHAADYRSGLGLGLYITQQIISLHDGTIDLESPADGGARFVVVAPIKVTANAVSPVHTQ